MESKLRIALATGSEELNEAVIQSANKNYEFTQIHYRDYLIEKDNSFDICVISKLLTGEEEYDKLMYSLKSKNTRVVIILLNQDKEELETCIKYQITDVLTQPVKPIDILNTINEPKTFKDIEFIYKKLGMKIEIPLKNEKEKKGIRKLLSKKKVKKNNDTKDKPENEKQGKSTIVTLLKEKQEKEIEEKEIIKDKKIDDIPLEKNKEEIQKEYCLIKAKAIAVINLSQESGSTFITLNLAYAFKDYSVKSSVIELPQKTNNIYNIIDDSQNDYIPASKYIEDNIEDIDIREIMYLKNNIKFYINNKCEYENWDNSKNIKFLNITSNKSDIDIYDIGNENIDENINYLLNKADKIFVVVDPLPYKLLNSKDKLIKIQTIESQYNIKIRYIINKFSDNLNKKEVESYLNTKNSICVPFVSPNIIYDTMYKSKVVYQNDEGKKILSESFTNIINEVIPVNRIKKKKGIFSIK